MYQLSRAQTCPNCSHRPQRWMNECPQCGHTLLSPERVREVGRAMIGAGAILAVGMLALIGSEIVSLVRPGDLDATTPMLEVVVQLAIFVVVALFGVVIVRQGVWQVRHGTLNRNLASLIMILGAVLLLLVSVAQLLM